MTTEHTHLKCQACGKGAYSEEHCIVDKAAMKCSRMVGLYDSVTKSLDDIVERCNHKKDKESCDLCCSLRIELERNLEEIEEQQQKYGMSLEEVGASTILFDFIKQVQAKEREETIELVGTWIKEMKYKDSRGRCATCGSEPVEIRGRYPRQPRRKSCPVCTREHIEYLKEQCSNRTANQIKNNE